MRRYIQKLIESNRLYKPSNVTNNQRDANRYRTKPFPNNHLRVEEVNFKYDSGNNKNKRRVTSQDETWIQNVLIKDNFTCQICDKSNLDHTDIILHAHHKDSYDWCINRRTDLSNGVTLCDGCHTEFHVLYGYGENTEQQYIEFYEGKKFRSGNEC